ncbi:MAG: SPFH domain-containing protein [Phycisphaerales bacterium]
MADTLDQNFEPLGPDSSEDRDPLLDQEEFPEESLPRRAASAQFVVEAQVGSAAAMREAMDPANQSLADALRLSFRVLLLVILVLLVLFPMSAFQIVKEGQSGVMLRWGRVVPVGDSDELDPGPHWAIWPYPAGEFVIFDIDDRDVDMRRKFFGSVGEIMVEPFWPVIPPNISRQDFIDAAQTRTALRPGFDGSVLTRDGDLAHLRITAGYDIDNPKRFVKTLSLDDGQRVVALVVQRAVVHVMAGASLQDLIDYPEDIRDRVQRHAQAALDLIDCGITVEKVALLETSPPMAVARIFGDLQSAREEAKVTVEKARSDMEKALFATGGSNYRALVQLIDRYEEAEQRANSAGTDELLSQINVFLESDRVEGDLKKVIERAGAHESDIDSTLGSEVRRFKSVLPEYRDNPVLTISRRLMQARKIILDRDDVEVMHMPNGIGSILLRIKSLEKIAQLRQDLQLDRREREFNRDAAGSRQPYFKRPQNYELDKANPLLEVDEDGRVRPRGSGR